MDCICEELLKIMPPPIQKHTLGVLEIGEALGKVYGADLKKIQIAVTFHDLYKNLSEKERKEALQRYKLPIKYLCQPNLAHGKIAAAAMEQDFGIEDADVLNAVAYHTTGRKGMSLLEKIVYVADAIEPGRNYHGVEEIRKWARKDLNKACILSMDATIAYVKRRKMKLDYCTLEARNWLEKELHE